MKAQSSTFVRPRFALRVPEARIGKLFHVSNSISLELATRPHGWPIEHLMDPAQQCSVVGMQLSMRIIVSSSLTPLVTSSMPKTCKR